MLRKERSAHEIGVGQWRVTTRRRWFHRAEHRPAKHRCSVEELTADLYRRMPNTPGVQLGPDGKYFVWNATIGFPQLPDLTRDAVIMIAAPQGGLTTIPALVTDEPLNEASQGELLNEWHKSYGGTVDRDAD